MRPTIAGRMMYIVLGGGLLSALFLFGLTEIVLYESEQFLEKQGAQMGQTISREVEDFARRRVRERLEKTIAVKAQAIWFSLMEARGDVLLLGESMTARKTGGEEAIRLQTEENFRFGEWYIIPGKDGSLPAPELSLGVGEIMERLGDSIGYRPLSLFAASKDGWVLRVDYSSDGNGLLTLPGIVLSPDYDARERVWYLMGQKSAKKKEPVFTSIYRPPAGGTASRPATPPALGHPWPSAGPDQFACVISWELAGENSGKGEGTFGGVVGIAYPAENFYREELVENPLEEDSSLILNQDGQIIASTFGEGVLLPGRPDFDLRTAQEPTLAEAARRMAGGEHGSMEVRISGEDFYLVYAPILPGNADSHEEGMAEGSQEGVWSLGMLVHVSEVQDPAKAALYVTKKSLAEINEDALPYLKEMKHRAVLFLAALLPLLFLAAWKARASFSRPLAALREGVERIKAGDFTSRISLSTAGSTASHPATLPALGRPWPSAGAKPSHHAPAPALAHPCASADEFEDLAESFNRMAGEVEAHMKQLAAATAQKARVEAGLDMAAELQRRILPREFSGIFPAGSRSSDRFSLFAYMQPAKEVGGDFYDFYPVGDHALALTIADVTDKGIPSALFMMMSKTVLKSCILQSPENLKEAVGRANDRIIAENKEGLFVTVFAGVADLESGELRYVNAGHNPPILRRDGELSYPKKEKNPILGVRRGFAFKESRICLKDGDLLLLYTDGVTEAMNEKEQFFSKAGLEAVFSAAPHGAEPLIRTVLEAIRHHAGEAEQSDDITMLAFEYRELEERSNHHEVQGTRTHQGRTHAGHGVRDARGADGAGEKD